eukprot:9325065-Pyramimonas_sp.AAC.1
MNASRRLRSNHLGEISGRQETTGPMTSLFGKSQQVNQRTRPTSHESVYFLSSRKAITRGSDPGSIKDGCSLNT